jgi:hypothetical protein
MRLPDVEALAVAFLKTVVAPVKVATKVPSTRPASCVRVYRTGGSAVNRILEEAQITVDAWAATEVEAFELASDCREALLNKASQMPLVRGASEVGGLHFNPDPGTNTPRYRFTVGLMVRAGR